MTSPRSSSGQWSSRRGGAVAGRAAPGPGRAGARALGDDVALVVADDHLPGGAGGVHQHPAGGGVVPTRKRANDRPVAPALGNHRSHRGSFIGGLRVFDSTRWRCWRRWWRWRTGRRSASSCRWHGPRVAGNASLAPSCDRAEGLVHAHAGRTREAAWALRGALAGFEQLGVQFEAARTREQLASAAPAAAARLAAGGRPAAAYERLACAPRERAVRGRLGAPS